MQLAIESLPASGTPEQLMLLLHGVGGSGAAMALLAQSLRNEFPQAAILAPDAPNRFDGGGNGRQWFSVMGISEDNRVARVAAAVAPFRSWVHQTQQRLGLGPAATAFVGFSQGAILALETTLAEDGIAGRVIAFAGRYARPPQQAPRQTTIHLLHGSADPVIAVEHARAAFAALNALQGDATIDIAEGVGHEPHPVLVERAVFRLKNHIPARTWATALGAAPLHSGPEDEDG